MATDQVLPRSASSSSGLAALLERIGERLNPLLVKECRQSLKSRQFSITFTLVVVLSWGWTIYGIAMLGPDVAYQSAGPEMFFGYFLILAFPLLLIVPFSAFRSLIAEREDNTFELVAITMLPARRIIAGKLGSAAAQLLVYLSAVMPCLVFTYMLRGIDVFTICWILFYTVLASLGFSIVALLAATIAKEKHWQIVVSVVLVISLYLTFQSACGWCLMLLRSPVLAFHSEVFWTTNLAFLTGYASTFALIYLAAGAQLTFVSENRSTPLRKAMLVQQMLFAGWVGYLGIRQSQQGYLLHTFFMQLLIVSIIATLYWYVMGALMLGENIELSQRVRRRLPTSFVGRAFLTWLNPGPGTGYVFAVCNGVAAGALAFAGMVYAAKRAPQLFQAPQYEQALTILVLALGYLAIYLGAANLLLRLLRRWSQVTIATALLVELLMLLAGFGIPRFIRYLMDYRGSEYTLLHLTDPFWSCLALVDQTQAIIYMSTLRWIILPAALVIFLFNLIVISPELRQSRTSPPQRVEEEDAAALAAAHPAHATPTNPWD